MECFSEDTEEGEEEEVEEARLCSGEYQLTHTSLLEL